MQRANCLTLFILIFCSNRYYVRSDNEAVCIQILHMNDILSKFDENCGCILSSNCTGGFARIRTWVTAKRNKKRFTLLLNAGDTSTGHLWHTLFRENITARFLNLIRFDAMSLSETDFKNGIKSLRNLLVKLDSRTQFVASNVDVSKEPMIANLRKIRRSIIYEVNDHIKIGLIGYLSPESGNNLYLGAIQINDEIVELTKEARYLKYVKKCTYIIALGHSGFEKDKQIAKKVEYINLVVGGHSKTFLYSRDEETSHLVYRDNFESSYPHVIKNRFGIQVLVVQAFAHTKYIGNLDLCFENKKGGKLLNYSGFPMILKDETAKKDPSVQKVVVEYKSKIRELETKIIPTKKILENNRIKICKNRECPIGNLVADAFWRYFQHLMTSEIIDGAVVNAGAFRRRLNFEYLDILKLIFSFSEANTLHAVKVTGETIRKMFQNSARYFHKGGFLQVSGSIKVTYRRLSYTKLKLSKIEINRHPLKSRSVYHLVIGSYIRRGRDGYDMVKNYDEPHTDSVYDFEAVKWFLSSNHSFNETVGQRVILNFALKTGNFNVLLIRFVLVNKLLFYFIFY